MNNPDTKHDIVTLFMKAYLEFMRGKSHEALKESDLDDDNIVFEKGRECAYKDALNMIHNLEEVID